MQRQKIKARFRNKFGMTEVWSRGRCRDVGFPDAWHAEMTRPE